ncbi:MAG: HPr family phosphocarrier protein [Solidesulfovibrio sp.]
MTNEATNANAPDIEGVTPLEEGYVLRIRVLNDQGLHARPAARLAQEAQKFSCDIKLLMDGEEVDAKSILDILTLAAGHGSQLELRATGPGAEDALAHLGTLIRNRFQ